MITYKNSTRLPILLIMLSIKFLAAMEPAAPKDTPTVPDSPQGLTPVSTPPTTARDEIPKVSLTGILLPSSSTLLNRPIQFIQTFSLSLKNINENEKYQNVTKVKIIEIDNEQEITIFHNSLEVIDLSNNPFLEKIFLECPVKKLYLTGCANLRHIFLYSAQDTVTIHADGCPLQIDDIEGDMGVEPEIIMVRTS